jgi:hypothetical protein
VARSADLVLMVLDGAKEGVNNHRAILERWVGGWIYRGSEASVTDLPLETEASGSRRERSGSDHVPRCLGL